jgi:hypothetical protein
MDRTQTISASVKDVKITLLITIVLVVLVIFLFLRNVRATLIPSAVIPLALLATTAVMLPLNFSLDNLSLMALTIAVGFVVDDAIVMVEVIWQRIEHGEKAVRGGAGRRRRDQLHHSDDLDLADRGVHAADVHGRRGRAADARVRRHPQRRGGDVARAVADLDADAVRQFLKAPKPPSNWFTGAGEGLPQSGSGYARALDVVCATNS